MKKTFFLAICLLLASCWSNNQSIKVSGDIKWEIAWLKQKVDILETRVAWYENRIKDLQDQIDAIRKHPVNWIDPIQLTKISKKLEKKLDDTNSYVYENTMLPNYDKVVVYYGEKEWDYDKKMEVDEEEKNKGIIIFKDLKDNTRYYYEIYGDGILISRSYFETAKKPVEIKVDGLDDKWDLKLTWDKIRLKFMLKNIKRIDLIKYKEVPNYKKLWILLPPDNQLWINKSRELEKKIRKIEEEYKDKKYKIIKDIKWAEIELTWLDSNKSYVVEVEYTDIYGMTWSYMFNLN